MALSVPGCTAFLDCQNRLIYPLVDIIYNEDENTIRQLKVVQLDYTQRLIICKHAACWFALQYSVATKYKILIITNVLLHWSSDHFAFRFKNSILFAVNETQHQVIKYQPLSNFIELLLTKTQQLNNDTIENKIINTSNESKSLSTPSLLKSSCPSTFMHKARHTANEHQFGKDALLSNSSSCLPAINATKSTTIKHDSNDVLKRFPESIAKQYNNTSIRIMIHSGKKEINRFSINLENVILSNQALISWIAKDHGITSDVSYSFKDKSYEHLLVMLSINILLYLEPYHIFFTFLINVLQQNNENRDHLDDITLNILNTASFLLVTIFRNPLMIRHWFYHSPYYTVYFDLILTLLESRFILHPKLLQMLKILFSTYHYWKKKHFFYLCKRDAPKSLAIALKQVYYHKNPNRPSSVAQMVHTFLHAIHYNTFMPFFKRDGRCNVQNMFRNQMKKQMLQLRKRKNKRAMQNYISSMNSIHNGNRYLHYKVSRFSKNNNWKGPIEEFSFKIVYFPSYMDFIKICANNKCSKFKILHHTKPFKMGICKGCKFVYYCSRRCQKYDWIHQHKQHCSKLRMKYKYQH